MTDFSVVVLVIAAFTPTIIAWYRNHSNAVLIFLLNMIAMVLFGPVSWPYIGGLGWLWACIWSICPDDYV